MVARVTQMTDGGGSTVKKKTLSTKPVSSAPSNAYTGKENTVSTAPTASKSTVTTSIPKAAPTTTVKTGVQGTSVVPSASATTKQVPVGSSYAPKTPSGTGTKVLSTVPTGVAPRTPSSKTTSTVPGGGTSGGVTPTSVSRDPINTTVGNTTSAYTPLGTYNDAGVSAEDKQAIDHWKNVYAEGQASGNQQMMDEAHANAEAIRGQYLYSGGKDGSDFIDLTPQQQEVQAQAIQSIDGVMSGFRDVQNSAKQMGDEGLVAIGAQWEKMNDMLNNLEAQITQQITSQMNGTDPAMQNALRLIREEADKMRKETMEELNARGLLQSGVYAKALSDMNNNELSQVQTAVASRFGDLQNQLNQAVLSIANTRVQALMTNQNSANSMLMNTQNNVFTAGLAGANAAVTMRGQDLQNSQFGQEMDYKYAGLGQNQQQFDATLGFNQQQLATQTQQFYDKLSQDNKQFYDSLSSSERMGYAQMASSQGSAAAEKSLAERKFEWEQQKYNQEFTQGQNQYNDAMNAQNKMNTNAQLGEAFSNGGLVNQAITNIVAGKSTIGDYNNIVSGAYTPEAAKIIMDTIKDNPEVKKKTAVYGSTTPVGSTSTSGYYGLGGWTP